MKKWIIICFLILIISIIVILIRKDNEQILGDGYYYLPKYEAIDVGYPEGSIIYKSSQKHLYSDVKVSGNVIQVNNNNDFIIAIRKSKSNDSLQYFIINKKTDSVYSTYNKNDYLKKRQDLEVPHRLTLDK